MAAHKKKKSYGFGLVGCGMIADFHARAINAMKGGHLACVYSRNPQNAKRVGDFNRIAWYSDYNKFLAHEGLDIVSICTPSGAHVEPCVKAAAAGKHVICEKPLEVTLERCDKIIDACKQHKVQLGGIFPSRFAGGTQRMKQEIDSGRLGQLSIGDAYIKWFRSQKYYDSAAWRGTWKLDGGGAMMNQGVHTIDLLQWFMGPVKEVFAYAGLRAHKRIEVEDVAAAVLTFKNGAMGSIIGTTAAYPGNPREVQVSGINGTIFLQDATIIKWEFAQGKPYDKQVMKKFGPAAADRKAAGAGDPSAIDFTPHQKQFENFVDALNGKKKLLVDGNEARKSVEIVMAIYKSALSGKPAELPLKRTPVRKAFE